MKIKVLNKKVAVSKDYWPKRTMRVELICPLLTQKKKFIIDLDKHFVFGCMWGVECRYKRGKREKCLLGRKVKIEKTALKDGTLRKKNQI